MIKRVNIEDGRVSLAIGIGLFILQRVIGLALFTLVS
jgi:hypothetical protein